MATPSPQPVPDRRRFLRMLGFASVSSALAPGALAWAKGAAGSRLKKPLPRPQPVAPPPAGEKPPEISEEARTLAAVVGKRYGLSPEQIDTIAGDFDGDLKAGKRLRDVKLRNDEEPDFSFHA